MADSRGTRNPSSLNPTSGEFNPHAPRSDPLTTKGHQVGQKTSPADYAPEFSAQTLPPGSAPASRTFQPNPQGEIPGQADNAELQSSGKAWNEEGEEGVAASDPLDFPGATSKDVHTGYGHPGSGQTSSELRNEGQHTSKHVGAGTAGAGAQGGSGLGEDGKNAEFKYLERERAVGEHGVVSGRNRDGGDMPAMSGAEDRENVSAEEVAGEVGGRARGDVSRRAEGGP